MQTTRVDASSMSETAQICRDRLPNAAITRMNTYAKAGCCSATVPTMQGQRGELRGSMLRPQHAGYATA